MTQGYPLSGKSTIANVIKNSFEEKSQKYTIIKTVEMRLRGKKVKFTKASIDESIEETRKEKDMSYKLLCERAEEEIKNGNNIILDATFHKFYRRKWVYELAKKFNVNLVVLWVSFNNKSKIKGFLKERRENPDFKDKVLNSWEQYTTMVRQTDRLQDFEIKNKLMVKIIHVDRDNNELILYNCDKKDSLIKELCQIMKTKVFG